MTLPPRVPRLARVPEGPAREVLLRVLRDWHGRRAVAPARGRALLRVVVAAGVLEYRRRASVPGA